MTLQDISAALRDEAKALDGFGVGYHPGDGAKRLLELADALDAERALLKQAAEQSDFSAFIDTLENS